MDPAVTGTCASNHGLQSGDSPISLENRSEPHCGPQASDGDYCEEQTQELKKKSKLGHGWRRVVRNFTPSYALRFCYVVSTLLRDV